LLVLCVVPEDVESACELLHALLSSNTAQNPATTRLRFLTELLNTLELPCDAMCRRERVHARQTTATHKACA
jgi:hypothetical protein